MKRSAVQRIPGFLPMRGLGGIKVIRWLRMYKQGVREVVWLVHRHAEIPVKIGDKAVPFCVVDAARGGYSVCVVLFGIMLPVRFAPTLWRH